MSYLVLARKYRPVNFKEVIGQEHITDVLAKAINSDRVAHAYLFCGPRGIGKTSCARILAKSLNCKEGPTVTPCDKCPACLEISQGNSFDVLEIDGASNRGIDEIRTLRENIKFAPSYGAFKIYIVDEVHMLTTEAFNALLKTLEEPPDHVKFIFATTDPNKVPATIISRCQRFDFKRMPFNTIVSALEDICKKEKYKVDKEALYSISKASQGSFRDALSILDQISAISDNKVDSKDVCSMLGLVETDLLFQMADALGDKKCSDALKILDLIINKGKDVKQLSKDLVEHFRNLMVIKVGGKTLGRLVDYPVAVKEMFLKQTKKFSLAEILHIIDVLIEALEISRITESLRIPLEIAFAKLTYSAEEKDVMGFTGSSNEKGEERIVTVKDNAGLPDDSYKFSATDMLKNKKGQVRVSVDSENQEDDNNDKAETASITSNMDITSLDLEKIKKSWNALTYAVSRKKMSLATYLQEGTPVDFSGNKLKIGFSQDHLFHKESLDTDEYIKIVEDIFSEKLKSKILVEYIVVDNTETSLNKEEEAVVQKTLDVFNGKVVSQWHKE